MAEMSDFVASLSEEFLDRCAKEQLLQTAERCKVEISDKRFKNTVESILKANLSEMRVLSLSVELPPVPVNADGFPPTNSSLTKGDADVTVGVWALHWQRSWLFPTLCSVQIRAEQDGHWCYSHIGLILAILRILTMCLMTCCPEPLIIDSHMSFACLHPCLFLFPS